MRIEQIRIVGDSPTAQVLVRVGERLHYVHAPLEIASWDGEQRMRFVEKVLKVKDDDRA